MTTNWREFAEELLRELDDALRDVQNLDTEWLAFASDGKTAKVSSPEDFDAIPYVETSDFELILDELAETWRRRFLAAQIVADRDEAGVRRG